MANALDGSSPTPVIRASRTVTRRGALRVLPNAAREVDAVLGEFARIDGLQALGSSVIARLNGTEADCAVAPFFFLSDLNEYIRGQVITVDDGLTATYRRRL